MKTSLTFVSAALAVGLFVPTAFVFAATPADYTNFWSFDEGIGRSVNDPIGGQNGVLTGSSSGFGWASGKIGTAVGMDGAEGTGVVLPNGILKGTQGSIALWLNAQDLRDNNIIFGAKSTNENNVYAALLIDKDGRPTLQFRDTATGNDRKAQGTKLLNKNEWYNLVITASAQTYRIYANGEEITVAGDNIGRWIPDMTNQTFMYRIGMIDATPLSGSWNGYLDDLKIYSRVLTLDEVKDLYTVGNASRPTIPAVIAPKVVMTVSEDHVPFGGSIALNWMSTNVDSCVFAGDSSSTATSGSKVFIKLSADVSYKISCSNKYGTSDAVVNVFVGTSTASGTGTLGVVSVPPVSENPPVHMMVTFTRNLTMGSRGDDVKELQGLLIAKGYLGSNATGYFGGLTKAALMKLQKERSLPQTGFFGPMTRATFVQN